MGALQELSLLTGIISKTALPGTRLQPLFPAHLLCYLSDLCRPQVHVQNGGVHVRLCLSGALETGGEVNSAVLMEFQGHINRFQVSPASPLCPSRVLLMHFINALHG